MTEQVKASLVEKASQVLRENIAIQTRVLEKHVGEILEIADVMAKALQRGKAVWLCGNGGSAADAQHVAAEMVGRFLQERRGWPVFALSANVPLLTALSNDYGYDQVFARQIEAVVKPGDVVVGISTSGNSPNVLKAIEAARMVGATTVGVTGQSGGKLKPIVDLCFCAPSDHTPRIQEVHITFWHIVCELLDEQLLNRNA